MLAPSSLRAVHLAESEKDHENLYILNIQLLWSDTSHLGFYYWHSYPASTWRVYKQHALEVVNGRRDGKGV